MLPFSEWVAGIQETIALGPPMTVRASAVHLADQATARWVGLNADCGIAMSELVHLHY